jgi:uncharacterized membrane protein YfcA
MLDRIILTVLLGSFAGLLGGTLGLGGSFIIMPGLILLDIVPDFKTAVGTTLLSVLPPTTLLAVIQYYKQKKVDVKVSIILFLCFFVFAYFGSIINKYYSVKTLEYCSSAVFLIVSIYFFKRAYNEKAN